MSKKSLFHRGQAAEIPPSQKHNIKTLNEFATGKKRLNEHDSVMFILSLLVKGYSSNKGFTGEPSKYYSLRKIKPKLKHIENSESIINNLICDGFIERSIFEDKIRITAKGLNYLNKN